MSREQVAHERTLPLRANEMARFEDGWLATEFTCSEDWDKWEMHPAWCLAYRASHVSEPHAVGLVPLGPDGERLVAHLERRTPWGS